MIYQDTNFKIYLSLYGWMENILPNQHIVHWCISVSQAREGYQAHSVTAAVRVAHIGRATGGVLPLIKDVLLRKSICCFEFCSNYLPPSPQFGLLVQHFLNAKNVDLSDIQNDSLSKILLK